MYPYFDKTTVQPIELMELKLQEDVYSLLYTDKMFYQCLFDFTEVWKNHTQTSWTTIHFIKLLIESKMF